LSILQAFIKECNLKSYKGHQNPSKNSFLVSMLSHRITIESFYSLKKLYESAWSPYSLIMECYKFLGIPLKVRSVMIIQKLSMKFIQCDYIIYNIVLLSPFFHFSWLYLVTWPITKPKILQKLLCDNILWIV
jgi:hypothetical protein